MFTHVCWLIISSFFPESERSVCLLWALEKDFYIPVAKVCGTLITDEDIRSLKDNECLTDRVSYNMKGQKICLHS
jgi:hypothetical protein